MQFFHGAHLTDSHGLLDGTGRGMRNVKVRSAESLPLDALRALVNEAFQRDAPR